MLGRCQVTIKTNITCKTMTNVFRGTNARPDKSQVSRLGFVDKCIKSVLSPPRVLTLNAGDNGQHALPSDAVNCLINSIKLDVSRIFCSCWGFSAQGLLEGDPWERDYCFVVGRTKIEVRGRASHQAWGKADTVGLRKSRWVWRTHSACKGSQPHDCSMDEGSHACIGDGPH